MTRLRTYINRLSWAFIIVGMTCLVVIILFSTASVTRRYVTGSEILAVINIAEFSLVVIIFLGLSWTQIKRGHINVEFFVSRFPKRGQQINEVFISVISLFFAIILVWASWVQAMLGYQAKETVVAAGIILTMWPIRFALPIGVGLYTFTLFFDFLDSVGALIKGDKE